MAQVSVSERNLFGTGRFAKVSVTYGQYVRGAELDFVEPYFLDQRISAGIDLFARQTLANSYLSYGTESLGGTLNSAFRCAKILRCSCAIRCIAQSITAAVVPRRLQQHQSGFRRPASRTRRPDRPPAAMPDLPICGNPATLSDGLLPHGQASLPIRTELGAGHHPDVAAPATD